MYTCLINTICLANIGQICLISCKTCAKQCKTCVWYMLNMCLVHVKHGRIKTPVMLKYVSQHLFNKHLFETCSQLCM